MVYIQMMILNTLTGSILTMLADTNRTSTTNTCCVYTMLRYSWWWTVDVSETRRVLYQINLRNSASCWLLIQEYFLYVTPLRKKTSSTEICNDKQKLFTCLFHGKPTVLTDTDTAQFHDYSHHTAQHLLMNHLGLLVQNIFSLQ